MAAGMLAGMRGGIAALLAVLVVLVLAPVAMFVPWRGTLRLATFVADCWTMSAVLLLMWAWHVPSERGPGRGPVGPMVMSTAPGGTPVQPVTLLSMVLLGWAVVRVGLVAVARRRGQPAGLTGALTAVQLALMIGLPM